MFESEDAALARPSQARLVDASRAVPSDIRLIAAVSRLIDLHQCRRESGVYVPEIQERSGYMLALALLVLDVLREIEMDRGPGPVAIAEVFTAARERISDITAEDVDFVIDSIAAEREVKYGVEDGHGGLELGMTKESTPLLEKTRGFNHVQLTENARLFLRVSSMRESWLYSDLDAERLVKAIERGQFGDIPRFCRMMVLEIATKNKAISSALERPTLSLRAMLVDFGSEIASSMATAAQVVRQATALVYAPQVEEQFELWSEASGVHYGIGNLRTEIELVMQNVEALSRRFIKFLEAAQRARPTGATGVPFLRIIEQLTRPDSALQADRLAAMLSNLMPWSQRAAFFSPSQLVGAIDVAAFESEQGQEPPQAITIDASAQSAHDRFADFLQRHADLIVGMLRERRSMRLSDLMSMTGFSFEQGDSPADFFGLYTAPDDASGKLASISVGLTGDVLDLQIADLRYSGTNPLILLKEDAHDAE
jgi:hypothetical protein